MIGLRINTWLGLWLLLLVSSCEKIKNEPPPMHLGLRTVYAGIAEGGTVLLEVTLGEFVSVLRESKSEWEKTGPDSWILKLSKPHKRLTLTFKTFALFPNEIVLAGIVEEIESSFGGDNHIREFAAAEVAEFAATLTQFVGTEPK